MMHSDSGRGETSEKRMGCFGRGVKPRTRARGRGRQGGGQLWQHGDGGCSVTNARPPSAVLSSNRRSWPGRQRRLGETPVILVDDGGQRLMECDG